MLYVQLCNTRSVQVFHGTPSGVDNTACTYGGCLLYNKSGRRDFAPIPAACTPRLLIINSRQTHNTAAIVQKVARAKNSLTETFARIGEIALAGETCLRRGADIGHLMTENNNLLNKLPGVSCRATDRIIEMCGEAGVPAKITGAGGGGVVIGLLREGLETAGLVGRLEGAGFQVLEDIQCGVEGVHLLEEDFSSLSR